MIVKERATVAKVKNQNANRTKGAKGIGADEARAGGRPEILTAELAGKICRLIETMPDLEIEVTWDNVTAQVERKYGKKIGRRQLSQKSWGGTKVISAAFDDAKAVQRRMRAEGGKRYATTSRQNLLLRIGSLEAKLHQANQELDALRAIQYDSLDRLRVTPSDLRKAADDDGSIP